MSNAAAQVEIDGNKFTLDKSKYEITKDG